MRWIDVAVTGAVFGLAAALLGAAGARAQDGKEARAKCANNLKQIGLGAHAYADDKRFYPHLASSKELDNKGDTRPAKNEVPPRCLRALLYFRYVEDPAAFVCDAAPDDKAFELTKAARADMKDFGWLGSTPKERVSPIVKAAEKDADADALTDLSYGWTLRGYKGTSPGASLLAADRARRGVGRKEQKIRGNHREGYTVVALDGSTRFIAKTDGEASRLAATGEKDPALVVWDEASAEGEQPKAEKKPEKKTAPCKLCGEERSTEAGFCPHCGSK